MAQSTQEVRVSRLPRVLRRALEGYGKRCIAFLEHVGKVAILTKQSFVSLFRTRFEFGAFLYQMEQVGVRSLGIAAATAIFVGVVMAIQYAFALEKFGAKDTIGRIVSLSETRELAPSLTALVVGSRVGAGMAAELGSMVVTEQVDAIRALGADPIRKLVVPRLLASTLVMPLLASFALMLGVLSAMVVAATSFGIPASFFLSSALDAVSMTDFLNGLAKTPFFGFVIAIVGCYYGLETRGGTEGVGRSTTASVVVVSIGVLVTDAILSQVFLSL